MITGKTWTELQAMAQRLAKDNNPDTLEQLKLDMNEGYSMFLAKLGRYFTRKQQFTDLVDNQQIYQTPIDCIKILGMTTLVTANYQPPVKEIRSEFEWRNITAVSTTTNYPLWYFSLGNDAFSLWPIPSQDVVNGLRLYYQPSASPLSVEDITSTSTTTTMTVVNGSPTVTCSGSVLNSDLATLSFQVTDATDRSFYEIISATATTLTLKSAYTGASGGGHAWRIGQISTLPPEYDSAIVHYALWPFFAAQGNDSRSTYHKALYDRAEQDALESYSSSNVGNVIMDDSYELNAWVFPPDAA